MAIRSSENDSEKKAKKHAILFAIGVLIETGYTNDTNVVEVSDGLQGEILSSVGWFEKYS